MDTWLNKDLLAICFYEHYAAAWGFGFYGMDILFCYLMKHCNYEIVRVKVNTIAGNIIITRMILSPLAS